MNYLIDTNIISELVKVKPNDRIVEWFQVVDNENIYISVLTMGEIRKGADQLPDGLKKEKLRIWMEHDLPEWFRERILPIDLEVADRWGRLLAKERRPLPAIDSLIAATALHFDLALVTKNEKDFQYPGLEVINPSKT